MNFTSIPDKLKYPPKVKATLSTYHSSIVSYVVDNYKDSVSFRRAVLGVMNTLTYRVISGDSIPDTWNASSPLEGLVCESDDTLKYHLSKLGVYVDLSDVRWDVTPAEVVTQEEVRQQPVAPIKESATPKENLYIRPPVVPLFDYSRPFASASIGGEQFVVYTSLPEVPTKQNEISATTDVEKLSNFQLLALFPNTFIRTRDVSMYEPFEGLELDPELGLLLRFSHFSKEDVRNNLIKYPHIFQLKKVMEDGSVVNFYSTIEIDGTLHKIQDVWNDLEDTEGLPMVPEFIKEYTVRRYLLERDILHVDHKYKMFGTLDPFLTLFAPAEMYRQFGYDDAVDLARKCVQSRVSYKQSRNPIIRRINNE